MSISKELFEIIACPKCKGAVKLSEKQDSIICENCKLIYPVKDNIPIMLAEEATTFK